MSTIKEKERIIKKGNSSTFVNNMSLPIHRWFRYSAGFSAEWVEQTIQNYLTQHNITKKDEFTVFDPFAGAGTTLLASEKVGVKSFGFESHPLISKIAKAKLLWRTDIISFRNFADRIITKANSIEGSIEDYPELVYKCYSAENLKNLDSIRRALEALKDNSPEYLLSWMAFVSILRNSSHAGTAQWQYVLPNKTKVKVTDPFEAYKKQIDIMTEDMAEMQKYTKSPKANLYVHDARENFSELNNSVDMIITSPPYANNYDYADATRLELSMLGKISSWGDLQETVRKYLIRSCTQQVSKEKKDTFKYLKNELLTPIYDEIFDVCTKLDAEKELHGGKKNYHTMIALYFLDLAKVWKNLRALCKDGAEVCFVIGDSAPYGIYVPVDKWLGKLALSAGFKEYYFEKIRDRNVKWKNRKHKVPLKEGRLWVKG
ncbi:DNA methyltransferase [Thermoanaerobacterium thermosaccharolyticum]|uniref:DNA methyltransferase n=1 Tax=Thermoanaerobacterium thermosaccharolyticum TaxID=1517 RepID=UPI00177EFB90|nr:DNA methyltransferase [Thermoanaerobacterium thermosaccharolyticum]MBE0067996.1 site-specific DNA-methyltransferase [Thermoanaerobacterium thermosaccharolyticum]MBE0227740.1 site-specific DNA-methyltransferase [Thermoanaerobacterium thermosaccharolyticum]